MAQGRVLEGLADYCRAGLDSGRGIFVALRDSTSWHSAEQSLVVTMKPGLFKNYYGAGSCRGPYGIAVGSATGQNLREH